MKAAVIYQKGTLPQYVDVAEPVPENADQILVSVLAVAIKHFDKGRASGTHYSADRPNPTGRIIGGDGVCLLPDGTRVFAVGNDMLAEKAIIEKDRIVTVPAGLDDATASALPNAVIGSAMALRFKAGIQPGDVVLINGATGFTGRVALQIARQYGAKKIIATGRNEQSLRQLLALGADEVILLSSNEEEFINQITAVHAATPLNVIIDYLWGRSAEMILQILKGNGSFTPKKRFVSVGSVSGDLIQLSSATMRSTDLQLTGSGLGSWTKDQVRQLFSDILPQMFQLAVDGKISIETQQVSLRNIAEIWQMDVKPGQRLVVSI